MIMSLIASNRESLIAKSNNTVSPEGVGRNLKNPALAGIPDLLHYELTDSEGQVTAGKICFSK